MNRKPTSRRFLPLLTLCATLAFSALALANDAPPATGTPAPAPTTTAPATPPAPVPAPAPGAIAPAPNRREEDEPGAPGNPAPGVTAAPSIFDRAAAFMKGKEGVAAEIAGYKKRATDAEALLATANGTIAAQNAELLELRAGRKKLEDSLALMETERTDVAGTVAGLGFPSANLPKPSTVEAAGESAEGLLAQFRAETDSGKKADLFARWKAASAK